MDKAIEEYVVRVYEVNGKKVVEITNLDCTTKKVVLQGKLADELIDFCKGKEIKEEIKNLKGFNSILKSNWGA